MSELVYSCKGEPRHNRANGTDSGPAVSFSRTTDGLSWLLRGARGFDIHAASGAIESHLPVDEREDRIVAAEADIFPRQKLRAALADDDVAGDDRLRCQIFSRPAVC